MSLKGENELALGLTDQLSKRPIHLFELVIAVNDDSQFVSIAVVVVFIALPLETCLLQCRYNARQHLE
jgi:hypothetical protein